MVKQLLTIMLLLSMALSASAKKGVCGKSEGRGSQFFAIG
jgi:hypothetical protein